MLGGPREEAACSAGDCIGGVPNRGGLRPSDSFNAEDRADAPAPGSDDWSVRPANGVCTEGESSARAGVGIWRTAGEPAGTGEPNLAMDSARGTDCDSVGEIRPEARDDEGTASGLADSECPSAICGLQSRVLNLLASCLGQLTGVDLRLLMRNVGDRKTAGRC